MLLTFCICLDCVHNATWLHSNCATKRLAVSLICCLSSNGMNTVDLWILRLYWRFIKVDKFIVLSRNSKSSGNWYINKSIFQFSYEKRVLFRAHGNVVFRFCTLFNTFFISYYFLVGANAKKQKEGCGKLSFHVSYFYSTNMLQTTMNFQVNGKYKIEVDYRWN